MFQRMVTGRLLNMKGLSAICWCAICLCVLSLCARAAATPVAGLRVLTEEVPPLSYMRDGHPRGFAVELVAAVLGEAGLDEPIVIQPWARAWQAAVQQPDVLLFSVARTAEREAMFEWIGRISPRAIRVYALRGRSDIQVRDIADLHQYRVGVVAGTAALQLLNSKAGKLPELDVTSSHAANIRKLFLGRIDVLVALDLSVMHHLRESGVPLDSLQPLLTLDAEHPLYLVLSRNSDPLLAPRLRAAFERVMRSSLPARLQKKYHLCTTC